MSDSTFELECPICHEKFAFTDESIESIDDIGSATFDCPWCDEVLVIHNGAPMSLFEEMRLEYPHIKRANFGYIEIPDI